MKKILKKMVYVFGFLAISGAAWAEGNCPSGYLLVKNDFSSMDGHYSSQNSGYTKTPQVVPRNKSDPAVNNTMITVNAYTNKSPKTLAHQKLTESNYTCVAVNKTFSVDNAHGSCSGTASADSSHCNIYLFYTERPAYIAGNAKDGSICCVPKRVTP